MIKKRKIEFIETIIAILIISVVITLILFGLSKAFTYVTDKIFYDLENTTKEFNSGMRYKCSKTKESNTYIISKADGWYIDKQKETFMKDSLVFKFRECEEY